MADLYCFRFKHSQEYTQWLHRADSSGCSTTGTIRGKLRAVALMASCVLALTVPSGGQVATGSNVANPSSAAETSNEFHVALPPSALDNLVGCSNPNGVPSAGTWGVDDALYIPITAVTILIGTPTYTSNTIFWISRETSPGESILMSGAFTRAKKTARVASIPAGTTDWQSVVSKRGTTVPTTQQGTTGLSFIVPRWFPEGVYGFEIDDPSAPPILGLANEPFLEWAIGVPSTTDSGVALQSQVHDCGAEPGEILRIFGKNFSASNQVILESTDGSVTSIAPIKVDTNSISAQVPDSLGSGRYYLWVGAEPWSATSSPAVSLDVIAPPPVTVANAVCSVLVGDGKTDNTLLLQSCLDENAPKAVPGSLVYVSIPKGVFVLTNEITIRSGEILVGTAPSETQFVGESPGPQPNAWFTIPQYAGMANLTIRAPNAIYLVASPDVADFITGGNPATSGHAFLKNMVFDSTPAGSNGNTWGMVALTGPDIQFYGSTFLSGTFENLAISYGDGGIISKNTFIDDSGLNDLESSQNMIVEENSVYSEAGPGGTGSAAFDLSRHFCEWCQPSVTQNEYIGYNTIQNMGGADNEIILTDGGAGSYFGPVASSSTDTVVLADDPSWISTGTGNLEGLSVAIVQGKGVGQESFVKGVNGSTITLESPWKIMPDSTSLVVITASERDLIIAHNIITNTLGTSILIARSFDAVIEDNTLSNSGSGILLWGQGDYGSASTFAPITNTDVLRNQINVGAGDLITKDQGWTYGGIGIYDGEGVMLSGLMVRDNVVPPIQSIFSTNGTNGISANVIEDNQAGLLGTFPGVPGFLTLNNIAP
jgi:Pectate lyase superfamily protein/Right handed beta helix region